MNDPMFKQLTDQFLAPMMAGMVAIDDPKCWDAYFTLAIAFLSRRPELAPTLEDAKTIAITFADELLKRRHEHNPASAFTDAMKDASTPARAVCGRPMKTGSCVLEPDHKGGCSPIAMLRSPTTGETFP